MQESRKSRRSRHQLEPLTYREAVESPALTGLVSFLDIRPEVLAQSHASAVRAGVSTPAHTSTPVVETTTGVDIATGVNIAPSAAAQADAQATISATQSSGLPPTAAIELAVSPTKIHHTTSVVETTTGVDIATGVDANQGANESIAPAISPSAADAKPLPKIDSRKKIYTCTLAQDGHSNGEEIIYQMLWREGIPDPDFTEARLVAMGWKTMARKARMTDKNCKANVKRLIQKLSLQMIRDENSLTRTPRTYRVFSYKDILNRRRQAGLVRVIRSKGVTFVTEEGTPIYQEHNTSTIGVTTTPVVDLTTLPVVKSASGTEAKTTPPPVVETPSLLESVLRQAVEKTTIFDRTIITQALKSYCSADARAVKQLIESCQTEAPDCSSDDIVQAVHEIGVTLSTNRSIQNPIGFLLAVIPSCVNEIHQRRLTEERQKEQEERKHAAFLRLGAEPPNNEWQRILGHLQEHIDPLSFNTWLKPTRFARVEESELTVLIPAPDFSRVGEKFADLIQDAIASLNLDLKKIRFITPDDLIV